MIEAIQGLALIVAFGALCWNVGSIAMYGGRETGLTGVAWMIIAGGVFFGLELVK